MARDNLKGMEGAYDDYERFRALDHAFHEIVDEGVGERGRSDDRARHPRYGGDTPLLLTQRRGLRSRGRRRRTAGSYDALSAGDGTCGTADHIDRGERSIAGPRSAARARTRPTTVGALRRS